jgi:DNA polymerase-3 subunit delta'
MPFTEILGQAEALGRLTQAIDKGRLAHAYIFEGPGGVGKAMAAHALARRLLCPERGACGPCHICMQVMQGTHPMFRTYGRQKGSRNISVDAIRDDLIPFLGLKSAWGEYKIAVVNPADALSEDAANMLLKTLEEPSPWSLLVLVSSSADALLPTIRSRCQRVLFHPIAKRLIADELVRKMQIAPEHANVVATLSNGSMGRALELAGRDFSAWRVKALDTYAGLIAGRTDPIEASSVFLDLAGGAGKSLQERREEIQDLLDLLLTYLRDLVVAGEHCDEHLLHGDRTSLPQEATLLEEQAAFEIFDRILAAKEDLEKNVGIQLALEELCIDTRALARSRVLERSG